MTSEREVQPWKAPASEPPERTSRTESGIVTDVKDEQFLKAWEPIVLTSSPIFMVCSALHPRKALFPMVLTLPGRMIEMRFVQFWNRPFSMDLTDVKYWNSSNDVYPLSVPKTPDKDVTASASLKDNSPSAFVSKTETSFVFRSRSAKDIFPSGTSSLNKRSLSGAERMPNTLLFTDSFLLNRLIAVRVGVLNLILNPLLTVHGSITI